MDRLANILMEYTLVLAGALTVGSAVGLSEHAQVILLGSLAAMAAGFISAVRALVKDLEAEKKPLWGASVAKFVAIMGVAFVLGWVVGAILIPDNVDNEARWGLQAVVGLYYELFEPRVQQLLGKWFGRGKDNDSP